MQEYRIPQEYLKGFEILSTISDEALTKLSEQLESIPLGKSGKGFVEALEPYVDDVILLQAIFSMGGLISNEDADISKISKGLASAYFHQSEIKNVSAENIATLSNKINRLLNSWKSGKLTFKSMKLYGHNPRLFRRSKIVSDIRLIFEDDLRSVERNALIIHQLRIDFTGDDDRLEEFFVSLNYKDLQKLKEQINRAIEKEQVIKDSYGDKINFIALNDSLNDSEV